MKKIIRKSTSLGLSTLAMVFIVNTILAFIVLALQLNTLTAAKKVNQLEHSQTAFFAAEGEMNLTVRKMLDEPDWPDLNSGEELVDTYENNGVEIVRTISLSNGKLTIDITATIKGSKRRLVAAFDKNEEIEKPLSIMLLLDVSGSMKEEPFSNAKVALKSFVDMIENKALETGANHRIGFVYYSGSAVVSPGLTDSYNLVREGIDAAPAPYTQSGYTNIGNGLNKALTELKDYAPSNSTKVVLVFSDGVANKSHLPESECPDSACDDVPCFNIGSGNKPDDIGNCCTQDPINQALSTRSVHDDYYFFSIMLQGDNPGLLCADEKEPLELGRLTLLRISNEEPDQVLSDELTNYTFYKETTNSIELENIYENIAEVITTTGFFEYREEIPLPDN